MNKNPFGSLTRKNKRTAQAKKAVNLQGLNSNSEERNQYNMNRHRNMARPLGYNQSVVNAGLERTKYFESCEKQGIKPDPKLVEQYQKRITNAINALRARKFGYQAKKTRKLR